MENLQTLTRLVCDIAREAGSYIRQERASFSINKVERKHAHDYVSYVDKGSEQRIVAALKALLPEAGFITEEGLATHSDEQYLWVVDPLDGTTNFIHGYAPYAVSIALCRGQQIVLGVVYEICADECYSAWTGGGAYLNGSPIHVSSQQIGDALICLQLPYDSDAYSAVAQRLIDFFYGRVASVRMSGSAAMSLCYVAAGRLDAYAERYIGQWDYMAGAIIVAEAGGRVTGYDGTTPLMGQDGVVATNGIVHEDVMAGIASALKQD